MPSSPASKRKTKDGGEPKKSTTEQEDVRQIVFSWENLVNIVQQVGGFVHPSLVLAGSGPSRGIMATSFIAKEELLIRIPEQCAISGIHLPSEVDGTPASPWLRCLGALLQAKKESKWPINTTLFFARPYIRSLPAAEEYETLFQWSLQDIQKYLSGTTLGKVLLLDRNEKSLEKRYQLGVVPFLQRIGVLEKKKRQRRHKGKDTAIDTEEIAKTNEFASFLEASMCISTRGFHLMETCDGDGDEDEKKTDTVSQPAYNGPFLIPVIDLLNHDPSKACTTLQRDAASETFYMVAERALAAGEAVVHSYGDSLTSAQLLQTFGFVPNSHTQNLVVASSAENRTTCTTPASLHRIDHIIRSSLIVKSSTFPKDLRDSLYGPRKKRTKRSEVDTEHAKIDTSDENDDEVWPVENIPDRRMANSIPDEFLISVDIRDPEGHLLMDDLITLCVVQFLPEEAFIDIFSGENTSARLDRSILEEDPYLGMLVCQSILTAVSIKADEYVSGSPSSGKKRPSNGMKGFRTGSTASDTKDKLESLLEGNRKRLSALMGKPSRSLEEGREVYGRTIIVEELSNLLSFALEIQQLVGSLDHSIQAT
ncbi:MAG: hypothetical protein SGILL_007161 [Bacillariaceae sp.]